MSKTQVYKIKATILGLRTIKATITPKYIESQMMCDKTNCRLIVVKMVCLKYKKVIVLDNEIYCSVDQESIHRLKYHICVNENDFTAQYKYKGK